MRLYRGTQLAKVRGRQKTTSWTTSLPVAVIYSARPGDVWRGTGTRFLDTSTVFVAELAPGTLILDLCERGPNCSLWKVMQQLKYGTSNGITLEEVEKIVQYMHNRLVGRVAGGEFSFVFFDEDGEPYDDEDVPFSVRNPYSILSWHFMTEFDDDPREVALRLWADSFIYADSATFRKVARRLGYGAVRYQDVFQGGVFSAPELLGCEIDELEGVEMDLDIHEDEEIPVHETLRPLYKDVITIERNVPVAELLGQVSCKPVVETRASTLKDKLLR